MHKRIAELAEQAAQESALLENDTSLEVTVDDKSYYIPSEFIKQFANLLVKDCIRELLEWKKEPFPFDEHTAVWILKEHFGVKE